MKNLLLLIVTTMLGVLYAQEPGFYHAGGDITTEDGNLYVFGDLVTDTANKSSINLNANDSLFVTGDILNYGDRKVFKDTLLNVTKSGAVVLCGNTEQTITGSDSIYFFDLVLNNSSGSVVLKTPLLVNGDFRFENGNLYQTGENNIRLTDTAQLVNESNTARIYGDTAFVEIYRTMPSLHPFSENIGGLGIYLQMPVASGVTHIKRFNVPQVNPSNGSIKRYYEVVPENPDKAVDSARIDYLGTTTMQPGHDETEYTIWTSTDAIFWRNNEGVVDVSTKSVKSGNGDLRNNRFYTVSERFCNDSLMVYVGDPTEQIDIIPTCNAAAVEVSVDKDNMDYLWSNGVNTQTTIFTEMGKQWVSIIDPVRGCLSSDTIIIESKENPTPGVFAVVGCDGKAVGFDNKAASAADTTYFWDFGDEFIDSDTAHGFEPSYTYGSAGNYKVKVIATSIDGCVDSTESNVYIKEVPVIDFDFENICVFDSTTFENLTTKVSLTPLQYEWKLGDGTTSTEVTDVLNKYSTAGTYTIELVSKEGPEVCADSIQKSLIVYAQPVASFSSTQECLGEVTSFTNDSTTLSSEWDFKNLETSNLNNPSYLFATAGEHQVTLMVEDANTCRDTLTKMVKVSDLPTPDFSAINACAGKRVVFTNNSTATVDAIYEWKYGDGNTEVAENPVKAYVNDGFYNVELVINDNGCKDSTIVPIEVYALPDVSFTTVPACSEKEIQYISGNAINTNVWKFEDGTSQSGSNVSKVFSSDGFKEVTLIMTNDNNCVDSLLDSVQVYPLPELVYKTGLVVDSLRTCGLTYTLNAQNDGGSYNWFTSGRIPVDNTQEIVAQETDLYFVNIFSDKGCENVDSVYVVLNAQVEPNLGNLTTFCDSTSLDAGYPSSSHLWSKDNQNNTIAITQTIDVLESGRYYVLVTDLNTCTGIDSIDIVINETKQAELGQNIEVCDGQTVTLGEGEIGADYVWNTTETTDYISVTQTGQYSIDKVDNNNCSSRDSVYVLFKPLPIADLGGDRETCDSVVFNAYIENATYNWNKSGSFTSNSSFIANQTQQYFVEVELNNCFASDSASLVVYSSPVINLGDSSVICYGESLDLDAENVGANYLWNNGQTTQVRTVNASGVYSVLVTNTHGCFSYDTVDVTVKDNLDPGLPNQKILCSGSEFVLVPTAQDILTIEWGQGDSIISTDGGLNIDHSGEYWIHIVDQDFCEGSDTVQIIPSTLSLEGIFLTAAEVCLLDSLQLISVTEAEDVNYSWDFGDGNVTSYTTDPIHRYTAEGTYEITFAVGNEFCQDTVRKTVDVIPCRKSINENLFIAFNSVEAYPNPANNTLSIKLDLSNTAVVKISIYDLKNALLEERDVEGDYLTEDFDVSNLAEGIYFVNVTTGNLSETIKVVKN